MLLKHIYVPLILRMQKVDILFSTKRSRLLTSLDFWRKNMAKISHFRRNSFPNGCCGWSVLSSIIPFQVRSFHSTWVINGVLIMVRASKNWEWRTVRWKPLWKKCFSKWLMKIKSPKNSLRCIWSQCVQTITSPIAPSRPLGSAKRATGAGCGPPGTPSRFTHRFQA